MQSLVWAVTRPQARGQETSFFFEGKSADIVTGWWDSI